MELITLDIGQCTITSVYKPPPQTFQPWDVSPPDDHRPKIVSGDFNSHSVSWGYRDSNPDGERVEAWAEANGLVLLHNPKLPSSFNSGRWKRGYNPDLIFVTEGISPQCVKTVCKPIPRTQHRPLMCRIQAVVQPVKVPYRRRFNFQKADWSELTNQLDKNLDGLLPRASEYDNFIKLTD
ncbi:uncharacterized protein LOC134753741 [Cydia strobilella]|uniref:uncharacterized protein LOC134753741 n=1 Tax=Cydia strobilella TaxID=1100964 RepID=UPI0030041A9B